MDLDTPPYDATVKNIRQICEEFRDISGGDSAEMSESIDDMGETTFDQNLNAAVTLGLFEIDEGGLYKPTRAGKQIGYGGLDEIEEQELFRTLVKEYDFYNELLDIVGDELTTENGEQFLERDLVQREISINFDLGVGDRTIESAAGTFLKILDECGVGEYKQGRRGYPTRLVVNEQYAGFLSEPPESDSSNGEDETIVQEQLTTDDKREEEKVDSDSKEADQERPEEGSVDVVDTESKPEEAHMDLSESLANSEQISVEININVSSSDWDSEDVVSLIKTIQSVD